MIEGESLPTPPLDFSGVYVILYVSLGGEYDYREIGA